MIVDPVTLKECIPRSRLDIFSAIFAPINSRLIAQDACAFLADVRDAHEGADVQAHAVVDVGIPADGLLVERLPADEDIVGRFAFEDQDQALLQRFGGGELLLRAIDALLNFCLWRAIQSPR